jgi:hypothetical protein
MSQEQTVETMQEIPSVTPADAAAAMEQPNPEDLAASFFSLEQPKLNKLLNELSQRQLRRLVFQLCSHPFTPTQYVATSEEERKAFYLGDQMIHNRMIMQLHYEMQKADEASKKTGQTSSSVVESNDSINTNTETTNTQGEQVDGKV